MMCQGLNLDFTKTPFYDVPNERTKMKSPPAVVRKLKFCYFPNFTKFQI